MLSFLHVAPLDIQVLEIMLSRPLLRLKPNKVRVNGVFEVLQITDLHFLPGEEQTLLGVRTEQSARHVVELARAKAWPPDLIVITGDLTQEPLAATYQRLDRYLASLGIPCLCLPGNHDNPRIMLEELRSENVYCSSQVLTDAWQIICLDSTVRGSEIGHLSEEALKFLEDNLDRYPEKFAMVCLHHHPLPVQCAWLDTMVLNGRQRFFDILESRPQSRVVICGHIHQELEIDHRAIRVFGTPSTCFQFKPGCEEFALDDKPPGFRQLSLHPDGTVTTRVVRLEDMPEGINLLSAGYQN
ncbi:MAG: 3',5'-cyclic-AMP phosphodiesterase [Gammaproteobacteria bacterium]